MIKIIAGKYGPKLLGPGTVLELSEKDESRLVRNNIAEYVTDEKSNHNDEMLNNSDADFVQSENAEFYLSEEDIKKMKSRQELVDYAESIGLKGLNAEMKKNDLVDEILNFIDENSEEE